MEYVQHYERLVVLQTMSKSFGLAGIRLGMALGDPRLMRFLNATKAPYNINRLTSEVALEALEHQDVWLKTISKINMERDRVSKIVLSLPFVRRVVPSDTNFIVFEVSNYLLSLNLLNVSYCIDS